MTELAQFTRGRHNPKCLGCPACNMYYAKLYAAAHHGDYPTVVADFEVVSRHIRSGGLTPLPLTRPRVLQTERPILEPVPPPTQGTEPKLPPRREPYRPTPGEVPPEAPDLSEAIRKYRKERHP